MALHEIEFGGVEWKNISDFVDDGWIGGKPEKLKKVGHITVYNMEKLELGK